MSAIVDTSVIVRYLLADPPQLATAARAIIESDEQLWVTTVVIAEVTHVLRTVYQADRGAVVDQVMALLQRENIDVLDADRDLVLAALLLCRPSNRVSVADALVWAAAHTHGPRTVYTFDRRFPADGLALRATLTR